MAGQKNASQTWLILTALAIFAIALHQETRHPFLTRKYPYKTIHNIWNQEQLDALLQAVRDRGMFKCSTKDSTPKREDIGEAIPFNKSSGGCQHPLMQPNLNESHCIFAPRMDIGRHYVKTGGKMALKEGYNKLISRMLSFSHFFIADKVDLNKEAIPGYEALFETQEYQSAVETVCPGKPLLDPFQLGIIVQIPGQQVPLHFDAPWFWGADRFNVPVWLLVVMYRSGLFEKETVSQLQGVAYIHNWGDKVKEMDDEELNDYYGGGFFHFTKGEHVAPDVFAPRPGSAILLNGAECAHGTELYKHGNKHFDHPRMDKSDTNELRYVPGKGGQAERWDLVVNGQTQRSYNMSDLRLALVWRSKCFKDEAEKEAYSNADEMTLESILGRLRADWVQRGKIAANQELSPDELGELLLDTYVQYPLPQSWMPFNYCALPKLLSPSLSSFLEVLLSPVCTF